MGNEAAESAKGEANEVNQYADKKTDYVKTIC